MANLHWTHLKSKKLEQAAGTSIQSTKAQFGTTQFMQGIDKKTPMGRSSCREFGFVNVR